MIKKKRKLYSFIYIKYLSIKKIYKNLFFALKFLNNGSIKIKKKKKSLTKLINDLNDILNLN
jgi:hypothetical protein